MLSPILNLTVSLLSALSLTRGPYLQFATPNAITVRWRAGTAVPHRGRLFYGTSPDALTSVLEEPAPKTDHEVRVTGLQPNTRYYYALGLNGGMLPNGGGPDTWFLTPPAAGRALQAGGAGLAPWQHGQIARRCS